MTMDGKLKWHNELNDLNYAFFESCDGIFLNYNWRVDEDVNSIANSLKTLRERGKSHRNLDIYFGIDVFGRGTLLLSLFNAMINFTLFPFLSRLFLDIFLHAKPTRVDKTLSFFDNSSTFGTMFSEILPKINKFKKIVFQLVNS